MDRTPRDSDTPFLVSLLARLKRVLCPQPRQKALQLVVLARGAYTTTTLMIAAFHENWNIRFALSPFDAMALLGKAPSAALVYDWDSHEAGWQEVCSACVQRGVPFTWSPACHLTIFSWRLPARVARVFCGSLSAPNR